MPNPSPRLIARAAGLSWLACAVCGIFAIFYVRSTLIETGDAAATARNIMASEQLWRLGTASELLGDVFYLVVIFCLYELLAPVSATLSRLAAFFGLVGAAVGGANVAFMLAPLVLLRGGPYLAGLDPDQVQALAYVFHKLHGIGFSLSMVFYSGFYLSLVGWLVFRSGFLPRVLGVLLVAAGIADLIEGFGNILSPPLVDLLSPYINLPGTVGELAMALWLTVVGVNVPRWEAAGGAQAGARV